MTRSTTKKAPAKKTAAVPAQGSAPAAETVTTAQQIQISRVGTQTLLVPIVGTSPLIVHNFSEKSKRQMLEAQQGVKRAKEPRNPDAEYEASFYRIHDEGKPDRYGFPTVAFKAATIGAARFYGKSIKMTEIRQFMFFRGLYTKADPQELTEILGTPEKREDVVRLGGMSRSADLRYRPMFPEWSAVLEVVYVQDRLSQDSVLSLIDAGGLGVGVGEWRPEKDGTFGTYRIDDAKGVTVV